MVAFYAGLAFILKSLKIGVNVTITQEIELVKKATLIFGNFRLSLKGLN